MINERNRIRLKEVETIKVLIADDDPPTRMLLRTAIMRWGYEVIEANDGEEAWEILQKPNPPQLLIIDWLMPKLDGIALCDRIRHGIFSHNYIILLTQVTGVANLVKALEAGADEYVSKPFNMTEFQSRFSVGTRILGYENMLAEQNNELQMYISRMEHLAEERARQLVYHSDLLAMLGVLISSISKEIYTTVSEIYSEVHMLNIKQNSAEKIKNLYLNLGKIIDLIKQLDYDSKSQLQRYRPSNLNDMVKNAVDICQNAVKSSKIEFDLAHDLPKVFVDPEQFLQAFIGLVINAAEILKDQNDGLLKITTARFDNNSIHAIVEHSGPIISADEFTSIFKPFWTFSKDNNNKFKLSIAMSHEIIQKNHGYLRIEPRLEGGLRFYVDLPVK